MGAAQNAITTSKWLLEGNYVVMHVQYVFVDLKFASQNKLSNF